MELLETQDPEKKKLIETSNRHKQEMEKEFADLSSKAERIITNALLIGGALALTYFAVSQLSGSKRKKKKKNRVATSEEGDAEDHQEGPSFLSQVGEKVMAQATVMLLDIAREKLTEYLQSRKSNEHS